MSMVNLLAGDVGGTTTRLGLFEQTSSRPRPLAVREFATLDFPDLRSMVAAFLRRRRVRISRTRRRASAWPAPSPATRPA